MVEHRSIVHQEETPAFSPAVVSTGVADPGASPPSGSTTTPLYCYVCGEAADPNEIVILISRHQTRYVHRYAVSPRCHRIAAFGRESCARMGWL